MNEIEQLSLRVGRMRLLNAVLLVLVVVLIVLQVGAAQPEVSAAPDSYSAREFVVVDPSGKRAAVLTADETGPSLDLYSPSGLRAFNVWFRNGHPELRMASKRGSIELRCSDPRGPSLGLLSQGDGQLDMSCSSLSMMEDGSVLLNASSKGVIGLRVHATGNRERCRLGVDEKNVTEFALWDRDGQRR